MAHHAMLPPLGDKGIGVTAISAGSTSGGFIVGSGKPYVFGTGSALGCGVDSSKTPLLPTPLPIQAKSLHLGDSTGLALDSQTSTPHVWGVGSEGQLGLGGAIGPLGSYHGGAQPNLVSTPQALQGEALVPSVVLSKHRTLLLSEQGVVYVTGSGFNGELGISGTSGVVTAPCSVVGLPDPAMDKVVAIAGGLTFSLAATQSGKLFFWGLVGHGGGDTTRMKHTQPTKLTLPGRKEGGARLKLAAGNHHALVTDGITLWALGSSWSSGGFEDGVHPRVVPLPSGVRKITHVAAGPWTAGVVTDERDVWVAGRVNSPYLLGGEAGPSATKCLAEIEDGVMQGKQAGANPPSTPPPKPSRADLLEELGMEEEIGRAGGYDGDGLVWRNGYLYSKRLIRVVDKALAGKGVRVLDLALGLSHGVILLE